MNIDNYFISKLAEAMSCYGYTLDEKIALGCMYRNVMTASGDWGFIAKSCVSEANNPYDPAFTKCLWAAEEIYYGRQADVTSGADSYSIDARVCATKIGAFYFYKRNTPTS